VSIRPTTSPRRPVYFLVLFLFSLLLLDGGLWVFSLQGREQQRKNQRLYDIAVSGLGLTDLCVATEARYTRHPAVTDLVVPFMDHPGAMEHFPTGSFWAPPAFAMFPREEQ
jgi:hypothetical protein